MLKELPIVAYFCDTKGFAAWSWDDFIAGRLALSGTHRLQIWLIYSLSQKGWPVLFLTNNPPSDNIPNVTVYVVDDLPSSLALLREINHDILVFRNRGDAATKRALRVLAPGWPCPVVMSVCNGPSPEVCRLASRVTSLTSVCLSSYHADGLRDQAHDFFKNVQVIYAAGVDSIAYDTPEFWKNKDTSRACYVGSLVPEKGFHLLAKVWPAIRVQHPAARLSVLGSAQLYARDCQLGSLGIADKSFEDEILRHLGPNPEDLGVTFHGLVSPQDYLEIVDPCSIGVVNPHWTGAIETFCNSAVELQSRGLALVGGNAGGLRETIWNGKSGILVSSEKQLQHAILRLLRNPETAREMGRNALIHAGKFTSQGVFASWERLLTTLIRGDQLVPPAFSWRRAEPKVILREGIRRLRLIPGLDPYIPTLSQIRGRF